MSPWSHNYSTSVGGCQENGESEATKMALCKKLTLPVIDSGFIRSYDIHCKGFLMNQHFIVAQFKRFVNRLVYRFQGWGDRPTRW